MTIQYLVTGREGMSNWEHTASSAITKTYSFKKIEDICEEWFDPEDIGDDQRVKTILDEFNFDCIKADIDGEDDWEDDDYQVAYDEEGTCWNCVDTIVKIESINTTTSIYAKSWEAD